MVNRIHNAQDPNVNSRSAHDRSSVNRNLRSNPNPSDEDIVSLANKYENKRARQVTEWERVQASNLRGSHVSS